MLRSVHIVSNSEAQKNRLFLFLNVVSTQFLKCSVPGLEGGKGKEAN